MTNPAILDALARAIHSAMFHASQNIAAAIRSRGVAG